MARPHTHVSMGRAAKSKYAPGFQGASEKCCLGQDESLETWDGKHKMAHTHKRSRKGPRQHKNGTVMRKRTAYCKRPYHKQGILTVNSCSCILAEGTRR